MKKFNEYELPSGILEALEDLNFTSPTPIQNKVLDVTFDGKDLIGIAQTGSGKTAAFCIPALKQLAEDKKAKVLILSPTRELAQQTEKFWQALSYNYPKINSTILTGGVSYQKQFKQLAKNPRVVIATPGRLLDHLQNKKLNLENLKYLVLDEADRMLDMGFSKEIDSILRYIPKERQSMLFSATWDSKLDRIAKKYLSDPEKIIIGTISQVAQGIEQKVLLCTEFEKKEKLVEEIDSRAGTILVFARTKRLTDQLSKFLYSTGYDADSIHGDKSQGQRNRCLRNFKDGKIRILVATDVAARGIDVSNIGHVVNYNLPREPENYVHRIGRTGRAGAVGEAISFISSEEMNLWRLIEKILVKSGSPLPDFPALPRQYLVSKGRSGGGRSYGGRSGGGGRSYGGRSGGGRSGGGRSGGGRSGGGRSFGGNRSSEGGRSFGGNRSEGGRSSGGNRSEGGRSSDGNRSEGRNFSSKKTWSKSGRVSKKSSGSSRDSGFKSKSSNFKKKSEGSSFRKSSSDFSRN